MGERSLTHTPEITPASRLQSLTRDLNATIVVSGALAAEVTREAADVVLLEGLMKQGPRVLRGRDASIEVWAG